MLAFAYTPLVQDFPLQAQRAGDIGAYINNIITFAIGLAGILAVVMIIIGGLQYVSTDAWSSKSDGKNKIMAALGGLILALASFLILNTIDPTLTNLTFDIKTIQGLSKSGGQLVVDPGPEYEPNESVHYDPSNPSSGIATTSLPTITPGDEECASLASFRARGRIPARDNSGNMGSISPEIAWLASIVPSKFPGLSAGSTYRSLEHNTKVGGSQTSAHIRGEAVDFFGSGISNGQAGQLVAWARSDVCHIGIRQVIFEKTGYNSTGSTFSATGHDDHVHIGR